MRDLIDIIDQQLAESRGLGARRSGEEFVSTSNPDDKIYVSSVEFYPQGRSRYDSEDELNQALADLTVKYSDADISLVSDFRSTDRAFGIAVFDRPQSTKLVFIKPFLAVKADPTQNSWDNQRGIPGFRYNSRVATKSVAGFTPQDVLTRPNDLTADDVIEQVAAKFGETSPLTQAAQAVAAGSGFPVTVAATPDLSFSAFRDYFAEILHPLALQSGMYSGNAAAAAEAFLGESGYKNTLINFGSDKREGLSDSSLVSPDGRKIRISSKGPAGAEASSRNILDAVEQLSETNPKLLRKYSDVLEIIKTVSSSGPREAPLVLGVQYGIITDTDADQIRGLRDQSLTTLDTAKSLRVSKKLRELLLTRKTNDPENVNMYFHALASVAHEVAEYVNANTNFSKAASEILNNGALVQVYTRARETADSWIIQGFDTIWPSKAVTGVKFSAQKTYYSTGIKGNFTFKILRNGAKDVEDDRDTEPALAAEPGSLPQPKRAAIKPAAAEKRIRQVTGKTSGAGRELRR